jgi:prolyl-tRNA editing enzyme YbaK/EbsC (Cys-tRNA(Pro) deacylase)
MAPHKSVQRFLDATQGLDLAVREMADSTHTAQEAADAVGAPVGAIVKSLVFLADFGPVLVLASGSNRVDPELLGRELGTPLHKADADQVKAATGWSIGGVPPFGHSEALRCVMDRDLMQFDTLWAAAGSPRAVFPISPDRLCELAGASLHPVC